MRLFVSKDRQRELNFLYTKRELILEHKHRDSLVLPSQFSSQ